MASQAPDLTDSKSNTESQDEEATPPKNPRLKKETRSSTDVFLVGRASGRIAGSKLPTCRQAFQYYLYLKKDIKTQKIPIITKDLAYEVIDAVTVFWNMARIKTMKRENAMLKFITLVESHRNLCKHKNRKEDPHDLRKKFEVKLDSLFDIGAPDAEEEIMKNRLLSSETKKEDIAFYRDQQTLRIANMSGHDKIFESKAVDKIVREQKQEKRNTQKDIVEASASYDHDDVVMLDEDVDGNKCEDDDATFSPSMRKASGGHEKVNLKFSRDIMADEGICAAGDRLGLSDNQVTAMVVAVLKAGGADVNKFTISRHSTRRRRICARLNVKESTLATFRDNCPDRSVVHWDGKGIKHTLGSDPDESSEHLAVLVTGVPDYEEGNH